MAKNSSSTLAKRQASDITAPSDPSIEEQNALSLLPRSGPLSTADRLRQLTVILETPYVSGRALAEAETVVTILYVGEGQTESLSNPGEMEEQYLYLCSLQTPVDYTDSMGEIHEHAPGDLVKIGLGKSAKPTPRDMWADILKEAIAAGETVPNIQLRTIPATRAGLSPAVVFRQLLPDQVTKLVN